MCRVSEALSSRVLLDTGTKTLSGRGQAARSHRHSHSQRHRHHVHHSDRSDWLHVTPSYFHSLQSLSVSVSLSLFLTGDCLFLYFFFTTRDVNDF